MRRILFTLLAATALMAFSCEKDADDTTQQENQYPIVGVTGPATASGDQQATFTVSYPYSNGCQVVQTFKQERTGNVIAVRAYGTVDPTAICTQDAGIRTVAFLFTPPSAGTFELRFTSPNGTYISKTLTVN